MGLFGYYSFYRKASVGQLLSIQDAIRYTELVHDRYSDDFNSGRKRHGRHAQNVKNEKVESFAKSEMSRSVSDSKMNQSTSSKQRDEVQLEDLWLYTAGLPGGGRRISVPCLTFLDRVSGEIFKITQDATLWHPQHGNTTSFLEHLEWYLFENLLANNYRIDTEQGICRFPLDDMATSQCITKGVLCRASPIFVAEISNLSRRTFIFPYHIEMECPSTFCDLENDSEMKRRCNDCPREEDRYQLTERKWFIRDGDETETVRGPGVIGLYPKVFVNQSLFHYESCSQQSQPSGGEMWGFFVFRSNAENAKGDEFELELKPYKLDWNKCQWI